MKILLIQPEMNKRPMDTDLKTRMAPSMALLTLLSLTPERHEVVLVNENIEPLRYSSGFDLVGVTVTVDVMPRAVQIAREFQRMGTPVVAGGIHITCCPDDCLPFFDAICVGAAERVWARMLENAENGSLQKVYHDMANLASGELASPAYGQIDKSRYLYTNVVSTSRGCPNRCDFCYNSCENRVYVRRPIDNVIADIRALGTRHVFFIDDNFIGSPAYTRELLEEMRPLKLKWSAAVTAQILDYPELLDLMAQTGCQSLFIGLESVNDTSLRGVNKHNQFEKYDKLATEIHRRGIMINASMVFGLDGDGPDVFGKTLDWLVKSKIETLTSHILTPYPGTALYRRMDEAGRITCRDLSKYNTAHVVFRPSGMTAEELSDGYIWMYRKFYSLNNILRRFPEHRAQRKSFLLFNLFYRKFGRFTSSAARLIPMRVLGALAARISYQIK